MVFLISKIFVINLIKNICSNVMPRKLNSIQSPIPAQIIDFKHFRHNFSKRINTNVIDFIVTSSFSIFFHQFFTKKIYLRKRLSFNLFARHCFLKGLSHLFLLFQTIRFFFFVCKKSPINFLGFKSQNKRFLIAILSTGRFYDGKSENRCPDTLKSILEESRENDFWIPNGRFGLFFYGKHENKQMSI